MRQFRTSGSVGAPGEQSPGATRPWRQLTFQGGEQSEHAAYLARSDPDGYEGVAMPGEWGRRRSVRVGMHSEQGVLPHEWAVLPHEWVVAERQLDFPMDDDCIAPSMRLGDLA
jgi:hypothetical protein